MGPFPPAAAHAAPLAAAVAAFLALGPAAPPAAHAQGSPTPLTAQLVASGFSQPLFATGLGGDVFVVEQGGRILASRGGAPFTEFFSLPVRTGGEQGLLGLAFDPGHANPASPGHRRFFVNYIDPTTGDTVVASARRSATDPLRTEAGSLSTVLRIAQPSFGNHKAGWLGFKPGDASSLYIATGDGGSANDPFNVAQNRDLLLGKMLRIDIGRDDFAADAQRNYGIPAANPFGNEVFAYGLRNPWRNAFDPANGNLWIADVGQGAREEVNFIAAASAGGQNFGWRLREGTIATPGGGIGGPQPADGVDPVLEYGRDAGQSITGGVVARGHSARLDGQYLFGDFIAGRVWAMPATGQPVSFASAAELTGELSAGLGGPLGRIASFGQGDDGRIWIVDYANGRLLEVAVVPEPGSWALLLGGGALLALRLRRAGRAGRAGGAGGTRTQPAAHPGAAASAAV